MNQDTGKFRNTKDQYYTKPAVAKKCINTILSVCWQAVKYQWIEPSAGQGAFLNILPDDYDKIGIDLEPKSPGILKADFLTWIPTDEKTEENPKKRIFFGNPPFGRQGSLAKSFIKHAAEYADIIAFILPRSFVKPSMSRAFPLQFHCLFSEELEKNSFQVNDIEYDVPCVFQIWEKRAACRILEEPIVENGFQYVKHGQPFHIAFKRVGGLAGKCYPYTLNAITDYNPQFHYFLKLDDAHVPRVQTIIDRVNAHVFPSNTVGPRSLSKSEANLVLNRIVS